MRYLIIPALLAAGPVLADPAEIVEAEARTLADGWRFEVTLRHGDTGEDDYADAWRVETEAGEVLGTRELLHPHVNEQPFTRSLSGVEIPETLERVVIRASTNVEGWADRTTPFDLPR